MQHQDPLDPMDTSQYTQQLVQYSQVEQSVQQTGTLKDILARLNAQDMAQASNFIGREARFDTSVSGLGASTPANWTFQPEGKAATMIATVTDGSGKVVREVAIDPATSNGRFSWDGMTAAGTRAPEGSYILSVKALDGAGAELPVTINGVGIVRDVVTDGSTVSLGLNGVRMPLSALIALSAAS
jgi:flagellar basal-body rod modification protein FlgD